MPFAAENPIFYPSQSKSTNICQCKIFKTSIIVNKILGRFYYSCVHKHGKCRQEISIFWIIYSIILTAGLVMASYFIMPSFKLDVSNLPEFLDILTNIMSVGLVCVTILHLVNMGYWINLIECFDSTNKTYLFCNRSRSIVKKYQTLVLVILGSLCCIHNAVYVYFKHMFKEELSYHFLFFRNLHVLPMASFLLFLTYIRFFTAKFICFENMACHHLDYKHMCPAKDIKFTHNEFAFAGFSLGTSCSERHFKPGHLGNFSKTELIEYLRITHETMCEGMAFLQNFCSPQMICYIIIEIVILILAIYSIAAHVIFKFDDPLAKTTFALNCVYLFWHMGGMLYFIYDVQKLMDIIRGLKNILTMCFLTSRNIEEHQQLRIFIMKLDNQKPFTVNDYFQLDLRILPPIFGSILTYLLVALQFEIESKSKNNS